MRIGLTASRFLVERLVVPEPEALDTQKPCGGPCDSRVKRELPNVWEILPQVDHL
ncbi:MAG: hypothetical protein V3T14_02575 [Myxococcota bacterium]